MTYLKEFGDHIGLDATHSTSTVKNFKLVTLMAIEKCTNRARKIKGWRASYLLSTYEDGVTLTAWLRVLCEKCDFIWQPQTSMSDCAMAYKNAVMNIFPAAKCVWCRWHVKKAWRKQIKSIGGRREHKHWRQRMYNTMDVLIESDSSVEVVDYEQQLQKEEDSLTKEFVEYLQQNFFNQKSKWMLTLQPPSLPPSCNNTLGRFHSHLKQSILNR